jgi:hypothetical protein
MNLRWGEGILGYCARRGLDTPDMCTEGQDACRTGPDLLPVCTETIPECPNVSVDEFVTCRIDVMTSFVEYNRVISCEAPPAAPEAPVASCVSVYERCPALASLAL